MSNFWHLYEQVGTVYLVHPDGSDTPVPLIREKYGARRLGLAIEGEEYTASAGKLTPVFGPGNKGFASAKEAEKYLNK